MHGWIKQVGRFLAHFAEMCGVMCAGAVVLNVSFFGGAALLGVDEFPQRFPELATLVIAISLSAPMLAWMRWRGMQWRPTLEMSGSTMVVGLLLIAAFWLDALAKDDLLAWQLQLACPVMLAVMLLRFRLYAGHTGHPTARRAATPVPETVRH